MANSNIITGQFVRIEQTPAKTLERVVAFIIDELAVGAYLFMAFYFIGMINEATHSTSDTPTLVLLIPAIIYPALMETLMGGQTLGKWLMSIRVVKVDGSSPDVGAFLIRWMVLPIDIIFFGALALFSMLVTARRQRLGDLAAGTMVIKLHTYDKIKVSLDEFQFVREGYQPFFSEAARLDAALAERIAHSLADRSTSRSHRQRQLVHDVCQQLGIDQGDMTHEQFLSQVLSDYRYFDFNNI